MQPPVRIKLYGLIPMTKRTYLLCAAVGAGGLLALLVWWAIDTGPPTPLEQSGKYPLTPWFLWRNWAPWVIAAGYLLGGLEVLLVLRRFRRAEAEQARAAAPDSTPKGN